MKTFTKQARQGDVFLERIEKLPAGVVPVERDKGKVVLAYGEVSGHTHAISERHVSHFRVEEKPNKAEDQGFRGVRGMGGASGLLKSYIVVGDEKPVSLVHQEHEEIQIAPGVYEVTRQREYIPGSIRAVAD